MPVPDQVGNQPGPPGLVRRTQPGPVVAMEVLVEQQVVLPGGVGLQPLDPAEARAPTVRPDEEDRYQAALEVLADGARDSRFPLPVGYSKVSSSPKKR